MKIIKSLRNQNKSFSNLKILSFVLINIIAILYTIESITINLNKKKYLIRELGEEKDPRKKDPNEICMAFDDNIKYDLFDLKKKKISLYNNKVELKFCDNIEKNRSSCIYDKGGNITKLAGDIKGEKKNKNKIKVYDNKLVLYLAAGEECKSEQNYKITLELYCNENKDFEILNEDQFDPELLCDLSLNISTKYACGKKEYIKLNKFQRITCGILGIIIGLIVGILGYNQRKVGMLLVCIFGSLVLALIITILFDINNTIILLIILIVFLLGGTILFYFFKKKKEYLKYYMLLIGGLCGYPIGYIIYNLFFSIINTKHQKLLNIIIIVLCIILGVILGIFFPKHTFIVGTSIMGAYLIMRGIGFLLYGKIDFIDEQKLYDLARSGNYEKIAYMVWSKFLIYPAILIFFIIVFIIIQIKINPKWKDFDSYKDYSDSEKVDDSPGEADFKLMARNEYSENPGIKLKEEEENKDNQEKDDKKENDKKENINEIS